MTKKDFENFFPIKAPFYVRNGNGVIALTIFLGIWPAMSVSVFFFKYISKFIKFVFNYDIGRWESHLFMIMLMSLYIVAMPIFSFVTYKTGDYFLKCIKFYLERGELNSALGIAILSSRYIKYYFYKKEEWFRNFITENKLEEKCPTYQNYYNKFYESKSRS